MNIYARPSTESPAAAGDAGFRLRLLGGFAVLQGPSPIVLPWGSQRLLVYLTLAGRRLRRAEAAGVLWPDMSERRAHANLRAALARLMSHAPVVRSDALEIGLREGVAVDLHAARAVAERLLDRPAATTPDDAADAVRVLARELLPGWYEDWALADAESWRQLRLHALEAAAVVLARAQRWAEAVRAAEAAVDGDPLRESARAVMVRVHLAEGNQSEALREFDRYSRVLQDELGLTPTPALAELLPAPSYA